MFNLENRPAGSQNAATITSLEIAELTGKYHHHVMRDIREQEEAWTKVNQTKFGLVDYVDSKGEKRPMYHLTKMESLYIIAKYDNEIRAQLIKRWHQLETGTTPEQMRALVSPRGVKIHDYELPMFKIINTYLVKGDIKRIADKLQVGAGSVSRVKRGHFRSKRIMRALIERCHYNKENHITDGYNDMVQLSLDLFTTKTQLSTKKGGEL